MHPKDGLKKSLKWITENTLKTVFSLTLVSIFGLWGGIFGFSLSILDYIIQLSATTTPLWVTILLLLLCFIYILLKINRLQTTYSDLKNKEGLIEKFGMYWDVNNNPRCLCCEMPLKNSTVSPNIFVCSDPNCNSEHALRNDSGAEITKQKALNILDELRQKQNEQFNLQSDKISQNLIEPQPKKDATDTINSTGQEQEKINIWFKDSILNHIILRKNSDRIKKCQNLKLRNIKLTDSNYWIAECIEGCAIPNRLHPSASVTWGDIEKEYKIPKCPPKCPKHIPIGRFKRHLIQNTLP